MPEEERKEEIEINEEVSDGTRNKNQMQQYVRRCCMIRWGALENSEFRKPNNSK